jgi:coiled-coil domain-containing protein 130
LNVRHHLGARARKIGDGILVIRFEMPFDVWCASCNELIPHGRRFNAEKKEVGKYLTSPIHNFRFKCNACSSYLDIQTDPKASDFVVVSGGRRKAESSESDETNENLPKIKSNEDRERMVDPFARLEHVHDDAERGKVALPMLEEIREATERRHGDSVNKNRLLRSLARVERKKATALVEEAKQRGLGISLLPLTIEDEVEARLALTSKPKHETKLAQQNRTANRNNAINSIFGSSKNSSRTHQASLVAQLNKKKVDMSIFQPKRKS